MINTLNIVLLMIFIFYLSLCFIGNFLLVNVFVNVKEKKDKYYWFYRILLYFNLYFLEYLMACLVIDYLCQKRFSFREYGFSF